MNIKLGHKITADPNAPGPSKAFSRNLSALVESTEGLVKEVVTSTGETLSHAKSNAQEKLHDAEARVNEQFTHANERLRQTVDTSEHYIKAHPWRALGLSAAIFLAIGILTRKL